MNDNQTPNQAHPETMAQPLDSTMSFSPGMGDAPPAPSTHDVRADVSDSIAALPAGTALLVVQRGPNAGARFLLDAESVTVGRDPKSSIFLDDVTVSRRHAEFVGDGHGFTVRDLGSLNGTYVGRQRADVATLRDGDEVQIGKYRMTFHPSPATLDADAAREVGTA